MRPPGSSAGRPPREIPPPLELECLKALWGIGEGTVRDVREILVGNRNLAYTTVMTVLDRLTRRGVVTRRKTGRAFVYAPAVSRDAMRRLALQEFLDSYFESSQRQLVEFLQGESRTVAAAPAALTANGLDPALL
jgi:predicted transcriptional regulator